MEPMTLGSPTNSPSQSPFLPAFLMGEPSTPQATRTNTLSPIKGHNFTLSPTTGSQLLSPDYQNRSNVFPNRTLFGSQQLAAGPNTVNSHLGTPNNPTVPASSTAGPPIQGLFDSLRREDTVDSPSRNSTINFGLNQSAINSPHQLQKGEFNDSYRQVPQFNNSVYDNSLNVCNSDNNLWITVFGFPSNATSSIISHFSQCGTIIDKMFPPQQGNWIHLKYSSRLECERALNFSEKIIFNNLMVGVTYCKEPTIIGKENQYTEKLSTVNRVRPLTQVAYKNAQSPSNVIASPTVPRKSTGIVNKAMDIFFGW